MLPLGLLLIVSAAPVQLPRGWLGIALRPSQPVGALVVDDIFPGSPADRSGVLPGDSLIQVNGSRATPSAVDVAFGSLSSGEAITLSLKRADSTIRLTLKAVPRPTLTSTGALAIDVDSVHLLARKYLDGARRVLRVIAPNGFTAEVSDSGLIVSGRGGAVRINVDSVVERGRRVPAGTSREDTISNQRVRLGRARGERVLGAIVAAPPRGTRDSTEGVLVATVEPDSPLAAFGLQSLDVIERVDGTPIADIGALQRALSNITNVATLTVKRGAQRVVLRRR
jgi:S1-C subfamily serine protease